MRIAYFDCFSGISGDMILGSLIDAGLDTEKLQSELSKLNLDHEYKINFSKTVKQGITGTKFDVEVNQEHKHEHKHEEKSEHEHKHREHNHEHEHEGENNHEHEHKEHNHNHSHRKLIDIIQLIEESDLHCNIKETAKNIFDVLAEAEAKIHNKDKNEVHFHEVGAVDSIVDIIGASIGFHILGIKEVYASKITLGSGFVKCAHGIMPVPAPATLELLKGIPIKQTDIGKELTTPTGAAIIKTIAKGFGKMPDMEIEAIGYGAGQRELDQRPNLLRVCIGKKN